MIALVSSPKQHLPKDMQHSVYQQQQQYFFLILFLQNVPRRLTIHDEAHFEEWAGKSPAPT